MTLASARVPSSRRRPARRLRRGCVGFGRRGAAALGLTMRPSFLVIGTQKGGTSSLYEHLVRHPLVRRPERKELHFFDANYQRGAGWYSGRFPLRPADSRSVTGEATPYYLFHPGVPGRVARLLPEVRLIVLLRDPVGRAYSQYLHNCRKHPPMPSFEAALDMERRLVRERGDDPGLYDEPRFHRHSYVARGRYAEQLERWFVAFPREAFLIMSSEELFRDPRAATARVLDFLELPPCAMPTLPVYNSSGSPPPVAPATSAALRGEFAEHNLRLSRLLGRDFSGWGYPPSVRSSDSVPPQGR